MASDLGDPMMGTPQPVSVRILPPSTGGKREIEVDWPDSQGQRTREVFPLRASDPRQVAEFVCDRLNERVLKHGIQLDQVYVADIVAKGDAWVTHPYRGAFG